MFRKILKIIVYKFIETIEKIEYRNHKFNQDDPLKKIINFVKTDNLFVETDYGFVPVDEINLSQPYQIYLVELENGLKLECADVHGIFCEGHIVKFVDQLTCDDIVLTKIGPSKVKKIKKLGSKVSMFDLSILSDEHSYYTNDILSLNTVSASIVILHTVLFNNDKGCMIVANRHSTTIEIIRKIKDIYKLLPFFLKIGVTNWNEKQISFENNSRIQTQARSKEPAIGFAIDLLYLDEFAKVPDNIIRQYYGAVVPTVSSIENSKIIITSTPDGYNLFWELLIGAEKPREDPGWNGYEPMRIYWHAVKGRRDIKFLFNEHKLRQYNLTEEYVMEYIHSLGYVTYKKKIDGESWNLIKFFEDDEKTQREETNINDIRSIRIDSAIPLSEICRITNWEEEQTNLIGGRAMFNQEFEIQFITDDKLLFDSIMFENFMNEQIEFETPYLEAIEKRMKLPYNSLKFLKDKPELFDLSKAKDYYITIGIDLAEGLGLDYSVFNIFRLCMKDEKVVERKKEIYTNKYDLFKLEQIGLFRNNIYSMDEMAHILYVLVFEIFDPEKVKIVMEMNKNLGNDMLNNLRHVFNDNNDFMDAVFVRYKHRHDDKKLKIGLLIGSNKKLLLKDFQDAVKKDSMVLHNEDNIIELKSFSKKETPSGELTFKSESGHDDCVMSLINLSSIFDTSDYKDMIDHYSEFALNAKEKQMFNDFINFRKEDMLDYTSVRGAHKRFYSNNNKTVDMMNLLEKKPFGNSFGDRRDPFERKYI